MGNRSRRVGRRFIMRRSRFVPGRVSLLLCFVLLSLSALAGWSSHEIREQKEEALAQQRMPSAHSPAELARWMEAREERHLPVPEYLESLLWRWQLRAYPQGNVPLSAYRAGAAHRESMP